MNHEKPLNLSKNLTKQTNFSISPFPFFQTKSNTNQDYGQPNINDVKKSIYLFIYFL